MKCLLLFLLLPNIVYSQETKDIFVGEVVAQWLDNGRSMKLINEFGYIDPNGKKWYVPKNTVVDGASIPRFFWTAIGGPFEGTYRNASVVHDYYCVAKTEAWRNVHLMFYNACITGGTSIIKAKIMYAAVYSGGPRWEKDTKKIKDGVKNMEGTLMIEKQATTPEDKLKEVTLWIENTNPPLTDINGRLDEIVQLNDTKNKNDLKIPKIKMRF